MKNQKHPVGQGLSVPVGIESVRTNRNVFHGVCKKAGKKKKKRYLLWVFFFRNCFQLRQQFFQIKSNQIKSSQVKSIIFLFSLKLYDGIVGNTGFFSINNFCLRAPVEKSRMLYHNSFLCIGLLLTFTLCIRLILLFCFLF